MTDRGNQPLLEFVAARRGARHITLIDPDSQPSEIAAARCVAAVRAGSGMIFVGGSTGTDGINVHETVVAIQQALADESERESDGGVDWRVPVVLFPSGAKAFSPAADAITFMMLMNSTSPRFLIEEQVSGALAIREAGLTTLSMGYIVCSPGGKVGEVGQADPIAADDIERVSAYAVCAESFGFKLLYLEAGSGAEKPVSPELVSAARQSCSLTLIVGGGIRTPAQAATAVSAGADWIVTGNLTEQMDSYEELEQSLREMISAF